MLFNKTSQSPLTIEEFLAIPETKPASEFIEGEIHQKPMPQGEHSTIQCELVSLINQVAKPNKIAYALPELRCTFGGRSLVPDIVVFLWGRIPLTDRGKIANRFNTYPDWVIEILSPEQNQTRVLDNLLHCSESGTSIGWLIDPEAETVLIVFPEQRVKLLRDEDILPLLPNIPLELRVSNIFNWLEIN